MIAQTSRDWFCNEVSFLAADSVRNLVNARSGFRWVVTYLAWQVVTSAAQAVTISEQGGTTVVLRLAVSPTGNNAFGPFFRGLAASLTNSNLRISGVAGNEIHFICEGYYEIFP